MLYKENAKKVIKKKGKTNSSYSVWVFECSECGEEIHAQSDQQGSHKGSDHGLLEHAVDERLRAVLGRAGTDAEAVGVVAAAPAHGVAPAQSSAPEGAMHAVSPVPAWPWRCSRHDAVPRRVPRSPHVQTGFSRNAVPRPFILPCIFPRVPAPSTGPTGTVRRCTGGCSDSRRAAVMAGPPATAGARCR